MSEAETEQKAASVTSVRVEGDVMRCPHCDNTGIDKRETDADGRITGCACDCETGQAMQAYYMQQEQDEYERDLRRSEERRAEYQAEMRRDAFGA